MAILVILRFLHRDEAGERHPPFLLAECNLVGAEICNNNENSDEMCPGIDPTVRGFGRGPL